MPRWKTNKPQPHPFYSMVSRIVKCSEMCPLTSFLLQVLEELPVSSQGAHPSFPPREERGREKERRWTSEIIYRRERNTAKKEVKGKLDSMAKWIQVEKYIKRSEKVSENGRENERRSQKDWRQRLISILAVRDVLSLITEVILHLLRFSSSASLLAECVSAVTVALSVAVC